MKKPQNPRREPRQARSRFVVESIVEAAARVFEAHGYDDTTTNRIAEVAGVSIGSVYQYFPNKDALITALHEHHLRQVLALILEAKQSVEQRSLRETVGGLVAGCTELHRRQVRLQQLLHSDLSSLQPPAEQSDAAGAIIEATRALLERHREEIRQTNPEVAAFVVVRMFEELIHASVLAPPPGSDAAELQRAITDAVVGFLTIE